jgi:uncharacterized protein (TIGR02996 family)
MSNALEFLRAISEDPADVAQRLVFADWLEEQGDWRCEFVRLDCTLRTLPDDRPPPQDLAARWETLRTRLSPGWRLILGRSAIENCPDPFFYRCPERWDRLAPTELGGVRYCPRCGSQVYHCESLEEARDHAREGRCVALDEDLDRYPGDLKDDEPREMLLGMM